MRVHTVEVLRCHFAQWIRHMLPCLHDMPVLILLLHSFISCLIPSISLVQWISLARTMILVSVTLHPLHRSEGYVAENFRRAVLMCTKLGKPGSNIIYQTEKRNNK